MVHACVCATRLTGLDARDEGMVEWWLIPLSEEWYYFSKYRDRDVQPSPSLLYHYTLSCPSLNISRPLPCSVFCLKCDFLYAQEQLDYISPQQQPTLAPRIVKRSEAKQDELNQLNQYVPPVTPHDPNN